jgi:hypothetical protein
LSSALARSPGPRSAAWARLAAFCRRRVRGGRTCPRRGRSGCAGTETGRPGPRPWYALSANAVTPAAASASGMACSRARRRRRAGRRATPERPRSIGPRGPRSPACSPVRLMLAGVVGAVTATLPPIRLHDLRHGAASLTYRATRDLKLVSEMLGHSGIQITADSYDAVPGGRRRSSRSGCGTGSPGCAHQRTNRASRGPSRSLDSTSAASELPRRQWARPDLNRRLPRCKRHNPLPAAVSACRRFTFVQVRDSGSDAVSGR